MQKKLKGNKMINNIEALIVRLSDGNSGALNFLCKLFALEDDEKLSHFIISKIICMGINGTDVYILYNDLGERDINKVYHICDRVPSEVLKDACSKQDRSGVLLIKPYMELKP